MPDHQQVAMSLSFEGFHLANRDRPVASLALHLGDVDLAADAVDHAMARAWARWDRLDDPADAGGWVYRVALNWATSWLRRLRFRSSADLPHHAEPHTDPADVAAAAVEDPVLRDALASLPMTTSTQAAAAGRRRQRGTRVLAATGAVALIAVAIGIVLAIQPLGVSDVVEAPGASCADVDGVDSTGQPGREVRLEPAGITGWARVDAEAPPLPTGEVIAVEWGLNGTGDVQAHTLSPDGTRAEPDFFAAQEPSSSDQPGDRYQTAHVFEQPGCWQLEMTRNEGSARLALQVVDAAEIEPAGLTTDLLDARIDQAHAAADDVDDSNVVHDALDDDIVTLDELEVARQVAEQCARDRDPTATITLGEHIGDIGAEHGGDANAVEDCIDRHLAPTQDALLTLFEPTVQQQTAVPNCGGDAPDRCVDDAEAAVDDIFLANMRRAAELGYGPASIPTPTSPLAQDDVGLDPSVVFDLGDDVLVAAGGGDAPGRAASDVLPRQFDLLVRCDGGGSAQLLF